MIEIEIGLLKKRADELDHENNDLLEKIIILQARVDELEKYILTKNPRNPMRNLRNELQR